MKTTYNVIKALSLSLLMALSAMSNADTPPQGAYIVPSLGYLSFDSETNLEDEAAWSLGAGYQFDSPWAVELVYLASDTESELAAVDIDYQHYRLDALYHFAGGDNWSPFAVAGIGEGSLEADGGDKVDQTESNLGIGVLGFFADNWAVRSDLRAVFPMDQEQVHGLFNIGLSYFFGSREPKTVAPMDLDNDGVPDSADRCKTTPVGVKVDRTGCPVDSDSDGVADYLDRCPGTPTGIKVDAKGCAGDSDNDGVRDDKDACLNTPAGAKVDAKGCRLQLKETVEISMQLKFNSGSADILPQHGAEIAKVGNFMQQYPDTSVVIEGHTDSQGAASFNQQLSQQRADSVRAYLIKTYNLDPGRITAKGFGESRPIANNGTREGRAQNRRVVAVIKASVAK